MKFSEQLSLLLREFGYTQCYYLPGGGCMHLVEDFNKHFSCQPVVHEFTAAIAAEGFNECETNQKAFVLTTTGPGLTNVITAMSGAYVERRNILFIAGQVKTSDLKSNSLRQRGIQEIDGIALTKAITKNNLRVDHVSQINIIKKLLEDQNNGLPGPTYIEICLDIQGSNSKKIVKLSDKQKNHSKVPRNKTDYFIKRVNTLLYKSKRPCLLIGETLSRKTARFLNKRLSELNIPILTTTSAIDRVSSFCKVYRGRPGTWGGQRAANLIIAQSDLLIALGARLDLQQTGYAFSDYCPKGKIIHIYPCSEELNKGHPKTILKICTDPNHFAQDWLKNPEGHTSSDWLSYTKSISKSCPQLEAQLPVPIPFLNPYVVINRISKLTKKNTNYVISSSGGSFTGGLQVLVLKTNQNVIVNPALASMGYGLGHAIGAAQADLNKNVVVFEGDGGFSQNIQDLAVVAALNLSIKFIILSNHGYSSIRTTQRKFFNGNYYGCDKQSGLQLPDPYSIFRAFKIRCTRLTDRFLKSKKFKVALNCKGPVAFIVNVSPTQSSFPQVRSKLKADGTLSSLPIYDLYPSLPKFLHSKVTKFL